MGDPTGFYKVGNQMEGCHSHLLLHIDLNLSAFHHSNPWRPRFVSEFDVETVNNPELVAHVEFGECWVVLFPGLPKHTWAVVKNTGLKTCLLEPESWLYYSLCDLGLIILALSVSIFLCIQRAE